MYVIYAYSQHKPEKILPHSSWCQEDWARRFFRSCHLSTKLHVIN